METSLTRNGSREQAGVAILIFNKKDFQPKVIKHDEKGYIIFIKGKSSPRESLNSEYLCCNCKSTQIPKRNLIKLKTHIESNTIIVGDFNAPLSSMKQKLNRDTVKLTVVINQINLTDIYRTFHPKGKEYTFLSALQSAFSNIAHMIGHKTTLNRYKKIEIIPCILSDQYGLRLVFKHSKNYRKSTYMWKLNSSLLSDNLVREEIRTEIKDILEFKENVDTSYPKLWNTMKAVLKGKFIALSALLKKLEGSYTNNLTAQLRALEKKEANSPKMTRRQEIVKLRAKINQIETKKTIQRISKTKSWFFERMKKIDKLLAKLTKRLRGSVQINKIINEKGDITTETEEIKKFIRS
jgi:hypothetical protein